jgi:hypothetical protein
MSEQLSEAAVGQIGHRIERDYLSLLDYDKCYLEDITDIDYCYRDKTYFVHFLFTRCYNGVWISDKVATWVGKFRAYDEVTEDMEGEIVFTYRFPGGGTQVYNNQPLQDFLSGKTDVY